MCIGGFINGYCCNQHGQYQHVTVPLIGASSVVTILDTVAQVELKQRYENQEEFPVEATYEYPLPDGAAVTGLTIEVDGKIINAKIKEKEQAQQIYDDAIAEGHGAYMLQQTSETRFNTSVGNLPPGKAVLITIVYVQKLEFVEGELEFVMPTTQFAPNGYGRTSLFTKPKHDTFDELVPYGVKVHATVQTKAPIVSLTSPSHEEDTVISSSYKGQQKATAGIHITNGQPLTKHWILRLKLDKEHEPTARVQVINEKQAVAMISFYPDVNDEEVYSEIVFVVDRSGSMAGHKMKRVKETLDLFLRSLPEGTMFNIVSFGTKFEKKFKQSVEYNEKNFKEATEYVKKMFATMGGTNIIDPLKSVFSEPLIEGVPRQVFLLTDGEVNNNDECVETVRNFARTSRVFMFGIGREADGNLVRDMAKAGNGRYETIIDDNDMEEKVMRHLSYALKPALVDPKLDWGTLNVLNTAPYHCPPLFSGNHVVFFAFVPANTSGTHDVTFTAKTAKGQYKAKASINFDEKIEGNFISKLAARVMIDDLTSGYSSMHDDHRAINKKFTQKDIDGAVVQLSLSNQIMSKLTAFVAVEKRREATIGTMKSVEINGQNWAQRSTFGGRGGGGITPLGHTIGGPGGAFIPLPLQLSGPPAPTGGPPSPLGVQKPTSSSSRLSTSSQTNGAPPPPSFDDFDMLSSFQQQQSAPKAKERKSGRKSSLSAASSAQDYAVEEPRAVSNVSVADKEAVRAVIQQQAFNGSFDLKALNSLAPKVKLEKVREVLRQSNIDVSTKNEVAAVTMMIVVLFEMKFSSLKSVWDLVSKKARNWAKKELGGIDITSLETASKTYLLTVV